jgi:hypothetical protein
VGTEPTCQQCRAAQRGEVARKASHHTHDFKKGVWLLFFNRVIPVSQQHDATLRVGRKSAKVLPSLESFFTHSYVTFESTYFTQKRHNTGMQARMYPVTRGLPRLG